MASTAIAVALFSNAALGESKPVTFGGDYYFYTYAQNNGRPACSERWRFNNDGTLTIYSGQEIVTMDAHTGTEHSSDGNWNDNWLILAHPKTNGQPDCRGKVDTSPRRDDERLIVYLEKDGGIITCLRRVSAGPHGFAFLKCDGHLYRAHDEELLPQKK